MTSKKMQNQLWIIDIDGTIVNVHSNQVPAWLNMFKNVYSIKMDEPTLVGFFGKPFKSVLKESLMAQGLSEKDVFDKYDLAFKGYVDGVTDGLYKNGGQIIDGAKQFLEYLGELNIPRAIATGNPKEEAEAKLKYFDLLKYFDITIFAGDHAERIELVKEAIKQTEEKFGLKLKPKDIRIIGDSKHDVKSAKLVNAVSIGLNSGPTPKETILAENPDYFFESVKDYKNIVDSVMQGKTL